MGYKLSDLIPLNKSFNKSSYKSWMDYETVGPGHRHVIGSLLPDRRVRHVHIGSYLLWLSVFVLLVDCL